MKGKNLRSQLEHGVVRAWDRLAEGWRELLSRSNGALTHYAAGAAQDPQRASPEGSPEWGLLATETWETAQAVIVRMEVPGMTREDLDVTVSESVLRIRGVKYSQGEQQGRLYHMMERAFGRFERAVVLPHAVDPEQAEVTYVDGVLTVILQKTAPVPPRSLAVS